MDAELRGSEALGGPPVDRDEASAGFFDAAAHGRLAVRRCVTGDGLFAPEVARCPRCGAATEWIAVSGRGRLVTWAVVHRSPHPALAEEVPYVTAVVELAEAPWLRTRLAVDDASSLAPGLPVAVAFARPADRESVPYFALERGR
jgi:uncharacterized OB-fold protein